MNNTVNISKFEEDGFEFFTRNLIDYLPYVALNLIGTLFGSIGNLVIIFSIACTKELRSMTNLIIANLAFADFLLNSFSNTFAIAG
jgi:hypothetical protein